MKRWIRKLELYGIDKEAFARERQYLSYKFSKNPKESDIIWSLFEKLTLKTTNLQRLKELYYDKALFLNVENKDCFFQLQQSANLELLQFQKKEIEKVEVLSVNNSCGTCKRQHGKVFSIKEALEKMPIPCRECMYKFRVGDKFGFCRCEYIPFLDC